MYYDVFLAESPYSYQLLLYLFPFSMRGFEKDGRAGFTLRLVKIMNGTTFGNMDGNH
jgi:hypothetical protein